MANVAKKKNALIESVPALVLLGLLAGAVEAWESAWSS